VTTSRDDASTAPTSAAATTIATLLALTLLESAIRDAVASATNPTTKCPERSLLKDMLRRLSTSAALPPVLVHVLELLRFAEHGSQSTELIMAWLCWRNANSSLAGNGARLDYVL
jgi:hypothetical protein